MFRLFLLVFLINSAQCENYILKSLVSNIFSKSKNGITDALYYNVNIEKCTLNLQYIFTNTIRIGMSRWLMCSPLGVYKWYN